MSEACVVIGCGSHSASVISIIESVGQYHIIGMVDTASEYDPEERKSGYKVILNVDELISQTDKYGDLSCVIAVGDSEAREIIYKRLKDKQFNLPNIISSKAFVDRTVEMGDANIIAHGSIVNSQVKLGSNNLINTRSVVEHHSTLKSHIHIAPGVVICGGVTISAMTFIGAGSIIIPHVSVAENTTLGAGSVLLSSIELNKSTFVGIPAKAIIE